MNQSSLFVFTLAVCMGCAPELEPEPLDTDTQIGACGDPAFGLSAFVTGLVLDSAGQPANGASVELVERNYEPGTVHGTTATEADGTFAMNATELVDIPDCWGTMLDYWVTATLDDEFGEAEANHKLFNAVTDDIPADFTAIPIEMELID